MILVSFTITEDSPSILVLSQADSRYWSELSGYSLWTFDFVLYKKGGTKVIGRSEYSIQWPRSITLTKHLEAGDYVLHVCCAIYSIDRFQLTSDDRFVWIVIIIDRRYIEFRFCPIYGY